MRNAGNAPTMLRGAGGGGCARGCSGWCKLQAASRGAAVRAEIAIRDDEEASPAVARHRVSEGMEQLTSWTSLVRCVHRRQLRYRRQLRCEQVLANSGNALMMLHGAEAVARGLKQVVVFASGEPRGGGACRNCDQRSLRSVS